MQISDLGRNSLEMHMLAAWLNVSVDQIPPENTTHLNALTMAAWKRVGEAAIAYAARAQADRSPKGGDAEGGSIEDESPVAESDAPESHDRIQSQTVSTGEIGELVAGLRELRRVTKDKSNVARLYDRTIDTLIPLQAQVARLEEALAEVRDLEPRPYEGPQFDRAASDACPECQSYRGHPIQMGICTTHRQPFYARERHDAHEEKALGYRCKSLARDALSALSGERG